MRVIDARSGQDMTIGATVRYGGGEQLTLLDIDEGLVSATAYVERVYLDFSKEVGGEAPLITDRRQIPLQVRFTHPSFFLQKVAFIPS